MTKNSILKGAISTVLSFLLAQSDLGGGMNASFASSPPLHVDKVVVTHGKMDAKGFVPAEKTQTWDIHKFLKPRETAATITQIDLTQRVMESLSVEQEYDEVDPGLVLEPNVTVRETIEEKKPDVDATSDMTPAQKIVLDDALAIQENDGTGLTAPVLQDQTEEIRDSYPVLSLVDDLTQSVDESANIIPEVALVAEEVSDAVQQHENNKVDVILGSEMVSENNPEVDLEKFESVENPFTRLDAKAPSKYISYKKIAGVRSVRKKVDGKWKRVKESYEKTLVMDSRVKWNNKKIHALDEEWLRSLIKMGPMPSYVTTEQDKINYIDATVNKFKVEAGLNPNARNPVTGCYGLFQLHPKYTEPGLESDCGLDYAKGNEARTLEGICKQIYFNANYDQKSAIEIAKHEAQRVEQGKEPIIGKVFTIKLNNKTVPVTMDMGAFVQAHQAGPGIRRVFYAAFDSHQKTYKYNPSIPAALTKQYAKQNFNRFLANTKQDPANRKIHEEIVYSINKKGGKAGLPQYWENSSTLGTAANYVVTTSQSLDEAKRETLQRINVDSLAPKSIVQPLNDYLPNMGNKSVTASIGKFGM